MNPVAAEGLTGDLELIHQPARLKVMALLHRRGDVGASAARAALGLTAGNLDAHARRLAEAGLVEVRRVLTRDGFEARYRITRRGVAAFVAYLEWLAGFLADAAGPAGSAAPDAERDEDGPDGRG